MEKMYLFECLPFPKISLLFPGKCQMYLRKLPSSKTLFLKEEEKEISTYSFFRIFPENIIIKNTISPFFIPDQGKQASRSIAEANNKKKVHIINRKTQKNQFSGIRYHTSEMHNRVD